MKRILFVGTSRDTPYLQHLKPCITDASCAVYLKGILTTHQLQTLIKEANATAVVSTSEELLRKLSGDDAANIHDHLGSLFSLPSGVEVVFILPLEQLVTVPYAKFVISRAISKITAPAKWGESSAFSYTVVDSANYNTLLELFSTAMLIAIDIETLRENCAINCISYTGIFENDVGNIETISIAFYIESMESITWMREFNSLQVYKVFQNGKYDNAYLLRYNAPVWGYMFDTSNMFHCLYSELPKDLAWLANFFIRDCRNWKYLANTNDRMTYLEYNARDTWATANAAIQWLLTVPEWARTNYVIEFPVVHPCLFSEMLGIKRDMDALETAYNNNLDKINKCKASLETMVGAKGFNPNSPQQVKKLCIALGHKDVVSTDEANLTKYSYFNVLSNRVLSKILEVRGLVKETGTYLIRTDKKSNKVYKEYKGRVLYSLNPDRTDTGRLASSEHAFWCGLNIQNQPRTGVVKSTYIAEAGFRFFESDLEQAESRDTAYIAGCESMIEAVSGDKDFHSVNCSRFFGVPYDKIYSDELGKVLDKALRDIAKRTNHGANYNIGANTLLQTMGLENVYRAKRLLKLPARLTPKEVCLYLLDCFHKTYPELRGIYYVGVVNDIVTTKKLTGATGWTRYCFGNPTASSNKHVLNSYIAHPPQSLNAMTLNKAYVRVFYDIQMNDKYKANFRLNAQIHDSILGQYRDGHEYLADKVGKVMEIPVTVTGYDKTERTFTVPSSVKKNAIRWSDL